MFFNELNRSYVSRRSAKLAQLWALSSDRPRLQFGARFFRQSNWSRLSAKSKDIKDKYEYEYKLLSLSDALICKEYMQWI